MQTNSPEGVAACILAYNPSDGLTGVLDALRGQSRLPECVVVVDNGSQPPIDASRWPESWHLIRLEENSGVGKGHNAGLRWAKERGFRWAWLLEHDDIPLSDCLAALTRHASDLAIADESWGVVYPKNVRSMAESRFVGSDREPADENFYDPGLRDNDRGITLLPAFRFTFNGPLVAVDRVLEIGGLREDLFVGHEDWDLSDRLRSRETGLYYARDALVVHTNKAKRGYRQVNPLRMYYSTRNSARLRLDKGYPAALIIARAMSASTLWVLRGMPRHARLRLRAGLDAVRSKMGKTL